MNLVPIPKATITRTGVTFSADVTLEELVSALNSFVASNEESQWAIGDTINAVEDRFSKRYDIAVQSTKYERSTLWDMASVCRSVETSYRNEVLLFGHHRVVRGLPPAKQKKYLKLAASTSPRMTVAELRQIVRENESTCDPGEEQCATPPKRLYQQCSEVGLLLTNEDPSGWTPKRREQVRVEVVDPLIEKLTEFRAKL